MSKLSDFWQIYFNLTLEILLILEHCCMNEPLASRRSVSNCVVDINLFFFFFNFKNCQWYFQINLYRLKLNIILKCPPKLGSKNMHAPSDFSFEGPLHKTFLNSVSNWLKSIYWPNKDRNVWEGTHVLSGNSLKL